MPSLRTGGMERVAVDLIDYFCEQNKFNKVSLILLTRDGNDFKVHEKAKIFKPKYSQTNFKLLFTVYSIFYIRKIMLKTSPDICINFGDRYNSFFLLSTIFLDFKKVITNRRNPRLSNGILIDFIDKFTYPKADLFLTQTTKAEEYINQKFPSVKTRVIPNPVTVQQASSFTKEKLILNVGRFVNSKNQSFLIKAFKSLNIEGWKLIFCGDGPTFSELSKEASSSIIFLGNSRDVNQFYKQASIFAFPSLTEGFPNALAESMSFGCACISYDCEFGPSDLIDNDNIGFLVLVGDENKFIEKLKLLVENEELRMQFSKNAVEKIHKFERTVVSEKYYSILANL